MNPEKIAKFECNKLSFTQRSQIVKILDAVNWRRDKDNQAYKIVALDMSD